MIKEKLMKALKKAASDYNGGMSANAAVAKAAEESDFNEKQAERLVEMFNTLAVINKEKDKEDPAGTCELATKEAVAKILMDNCGSVKSASAIHSDHDYSFYSTDPSRTNPSIEARNRGRDEMMKSASGMEEPQEPAELNVSQRSLYKIIQGKIALVKSAADAADEVVRQLGLEIERESIKVAKEIESPMSDDTIADMFKAACPHEKAVGKISEYSTKVAYSNGGRYAKMHVFDSSPVEDLLKSAENIERNIDMVAEYERKRDFYLSKAAEADREMLGAVGLDKKASSEKHASIADMFHVVARKPSGREGEDDSDGGAGSSSKTAGAVSDDIQKLAKELEKDAALPRMLLNVNAPSADDAYEALSKVQGIDHEKQLLMNVRRSIILADLMNNDPIIRDADPDVVSEAYKTMVMTSPRVSLDKAQARAFLRSAVNSVAISPSDAKVIADVDKGIALSNIDRLTARDSSIKDSNIMG